MVVRGAGAAGPVLLARRQWDALGLARRLPSLGVGAWRSAPLLPWRVQCPVRVCVALAAGSGGSGRYPGLCPSRFPLPAARVPRCVWRAVPSGCPLPSPAGRPFHAVCAFRALGPVALSVVPACPLRVCVLALPRRPSPPPLGGVVCAPRAVLALGAGGVVPRGPCPSACPAPVPCSVWRAWGGAVRSRFPPKWLGAVRPPWGGSVAFVCRGRVRGGGGGPCAVPPFCAVGGASREGGCSASFRPSAFPGQATKRVSLASFWSWGAWPPYHSGSCSPAFSGRDLCGLSWHAGAGLLVPRGSCGSRQLGQGRGLCSGSSLGQGEGKPSPLPRRVEARAPAACGLVGGWGEGSRRGLPAPPLGGGPRFPTLAPLCHNPPRRARSVGVAGPPRGGGMRGGPWTAPSGAPSDLNLPSAPPRVGNGHGGGHGGHGLHTVLVRRRAPPPGSVRAPLRTAGVGSQVGRDPRWSRRLGALGRALCRSSRIPPPASHSLLGVGGRPLGSWGAEGRSCGPQAVGGEQGGGR